MSRNSGVGEHNELDLNQDSSFWGSGPSVCHLNAAEGIGGGEPSVSGQSLGIFPGHEGNHLNGELHATVDGGQGRVTGDQGGFLGHTSQDQLPEGSASVASGTADSGGFVPLAYCEGSNLGQQFRARRREDQDSEELLLPNSLLSSWPWDQEVARPGFHAVAPPISLGGQQHHFGGQQGQLAQAAGAQGYAVYNQVDTSRMVGPGVPSGAAVPSSVKKIHKADREKLRRDKLNEHFLELAAVLDPERPKNDKARVLGDGLEVVKELHQEVKRLRVEHSSLEEESKELAAEKVELRGERAMLRAELEQLQMELYRRLVPCMGTGTYDISAWGGGMPGYAMPPAPPRLSQTGESLVSGARPSSPPAQQPGQGAAPPPQVPQQHQMRPPMPYPQHPPPGMPYLPLDPATLAAYAAAAMQPFQHILNMQHPDTHPYFPNNPYAQHAQYARPPMPPPPQPPHSSHNVERPFPQYPPLPQPLLGMPSPPHPSYLSLLSAPQPHSSPAALAGGFGGGGVFPSYLPGMPLPPPGSQHVPPQYQQPPPQQSLHHPMASFSYPPLTAAPAPALGPPQPAPQPGGSSQAPPRGLEFWQFHPPRQVRASGASREEAPRAGDDGRGESQAAATTCEEPSTSATAGRPSWAEQEEAAGGPSRASARASTTPNTQQPAGAACDISSPPHNNSDRPTWMQDQASSRRESSRSHFPSPPPPDPGV